MPYAPVRILMRKSGSKVEEAAVKKLTEFVGAKLEKIARDALKKAKDSGYANIEIGDVQIIIERDYRNFLSNFDLAKVRAHFLPFSPMRDLMENDGCVVPETTAICLTSIFEEFLKILVKGVMVFMKTSQNPGKVTSQDVDYVIRDVFKDNP